MYVLRELWRGEISPTDRRVRQGSEYQQRTAEVRKQIVEFAATLSPEAKERMEDISDQCLLDSSSKGISMSMCFAIPLKWL